MFHKLATAAFGAALLLAAPAFAQDQDALRQAPPPAPYAKVSDLVALPDFLPGLGSSSSIQRLCRRGPSLATITTASWRRPST